MQWSPGYSLYIGPCIRLEPSTIRYLYCSTHTNLIPGACSMGIKFVYWTDDNRKRPKREEQTDSVTTRRWQKEKTEVRTEQIIDRPHIEAISSKCISVLWLFLFFFFLRGTSWRGRMGTEVRQQNEFSAHQWTKTVAYYYTFFLFFFLLRMGTYDCNRSLYIGAAIISHAHLSRTYDAFESSRFPVGTILFHRTFRIRIIRVHITCQRSWTVVGIIEIAQKNHICIGNVSNCRFAAVYNDNYGLNVILFSCSLRRITRQNRPRRVQFEQTNIIITII